MVQATIDGLPGQFEIDTGARSALTLMHPFAVTNNLIGKYHAVHTATTGYGVGGPSKALLTRAGTLTIGPVTLKSPVVDIVTDTRGAAADEHTAGNIGGDILKRFTVTLDYGHQQIYFEPNALATQPDVFDRSGLWVNRDADGMIDIADVSADSAATTAGLVVGDKILSVNGHDARTVEIFELREIFKAKPGTMVHLRVQRAGGKTKPITLTLADQV
jgi:membrane-associated protease RseP (regulator of RpoE activity)